MMIKTFVTKLLLALLTVLSLNAAVLVHVGDDTEAYFGEDIVSYYDQDSEDSIPGVVEVISTRFGLTSANLAAWSVIQDQVYENGVVNDTWPFLFLDFETPHYSLTCYTLADFWSVPSPTINGTVIDQHFYPFEVWSVDYSQGPFYLDITGHSEVWLDWNSDTTLRVTWGATEPDEFNRYLHDGTENPNWVAPLAASKGKGKKLGHSK